MNQKRREKIAMAEYTLKCLTEEAEYLEWQGRCDWAKKNSQQTEGGGSWSPG
jgi:hypothetical protein